MNKVISVVFLFVIFSLGMISFSYAESQNFNHAKGTECKIKKGDMLRKISLKYYGTELMAKFLANVNGIKNPDKIYAGTVIKVPYTGRKGNIKRSIKSLRNNVVVKSQTKQVDVVKEVEVAKEEETPVVESALEQTSAAVEQSKAIENNSDKQTDIFSLVANADKQEKEQTPAALDEKTNSASNIVPVVDDKSKLAQEGKEPMPQSSLEFTKDDVMPENAPEAKKAESHNVHESSGSNGTEHQFSLNVMSSKNKADIMRGGMLDYMAWIKTPSLNENFSLGAGMFASAWEDKISNAYISAIMPGVQLGFKYNRHTDDHLMRMMFGKFMIGKEFQNVRQEPSATLVPATDSMTKMTSMETEEVMPADDAMSLDASSDNMDESMVIKSGNNFRIGSMLGIHYQLNPKSTLELMNENWFSLGGAAVMEMDPAFSLIASHVYTFGDWSWRSGIGPQYEDWSKTWRLHAVPAEITYKEIITLGVFSDLYPWKKGEMYSGFAARDLSSIGAILRFNIGANKHKGHEAIDH